MHHFFALHGAPPLRTCGHIWHLKSSRQAQRRTERKHSPMHVHARMHSPFRCPVATLKPASHRPPAKRSSQAPIGAALNWPS